MTKTITAKKLIDLLQNAAWEYNQGEFNRTSRQENFTSWDESTGIRVCGYVEIYAELDGIKATYTERFSYIEGNIYSLESQADDLAFEVDGADVTNEDGEILNRSEISDILQRASYDFDDRFTLIDWAGLEI